ncbi:MAG: hypothetical protein M1833_004845 [Piccolia ochrophora]|nr:MAG: hypothetical protein M1833_004845 [Piccolia ochrophora]
MVGIKEIRISNSTFSTKSSGPVALFVGGTGGIGKGSLIQFAKHANAPTVYVVGRSKSSAAGFLHELKDLNPQGVFNFLEYDFALVENVDAVCDEIKRKERRLDLIFLTPTRVSLSGRHETSEGIDTLLSLSFYARLRTVHNLMPLLAVADLPRVISVLAGGKEGGLDVNNLEARENYSLKNAMTTAATQTTLAFEELAKSYPMVTFCHVYPGFVNTGQLDKLTGTAKGFWALPAVLARWIAIPVVKMFGRTIEEAGERGLFISSSAKYPPAKPKHPQEVGIALPERVDVARSTIVKDGTGNGVYRLDANGESVENENDQILADFRAEDMGRTVWDRTATLWERALDRAHEA